MDSGCDQKAVGAIDFTTSTLKTTKLHNSSQLEIGNIYCSLVRLKSYALWNQYLQLILRCFEISYYVSLSLFKN